MLVVRERGVSLCFPTTQQSISLPNLNFDDNRDAKFWRQFRGKNSNARTVREKFDHECPGILHLAQCREPLYTVDSYSPVTRLAAVGDRPNLSNDETYGPRVPLKPV